MCVPAGVLYDAVKPPYNGAIKMAFQKIFAVLRKFEPCGLSGFNKASVSGADELNASASGEVETLT